MHRTTCGRSRGCWSGSGLTSRRRSRSRSARSMKRATGCSRCCRTPCGWGCISSCNSNRPAGWRSLQTTSWTARSWRTTTRTRPALPRPDPHATRRTTSGGSTPRRTRVRRTGTASSHPVAHAPHATVPRSAPRWWRWVNGWGAGSDPGAANVVVPAQPCRLSRRG